ncbi:hypothetical protein [Streptomyces sp. NPDC085529]|uniref:hypothetical protein n=1 Tax=Streptomyces sp. NPDC085529 TaxID=3365729 RepID=UPI0037D5BF1A
MGERVVHLVTGRMFDFIEFDDDYALVKTVAPVRGGRFKGDPKDRVRSVNGPAAAGLRPTFLE